MKDKSPTFVFHPESHSSINTSVWPYYQPNVGSAHSSLYKRYNSIIEAINKEKELPKYILIFPDHDLILQLNYFNIRIGYILHECIHWLSKNVDRAMTNRKEYIKQILPGAVGLEPEIIWNGMINRPLIKNHPFHPYNLVVKLSRTFNDILISEAKKSTYAKVIIPLNSSSIYDMFDNYGNLTFLRKKNYSKFIDAQLKKYDLEGFPPYLDQGDHGKRSISTTRDTHNRC